jgi:hypothetical protein
MAATYKLIAIIGKENLTRLQRALGPRNVYVPNLAQRSHPIANAIGYAAMQALCHHHGGETVWIGSGYANAERNQEISRMHREGVPAQTIAEHYQITERYVRAIASAEGDDGDHRASEKESHQ